MAACAARPTSVPDDFRSRAGNWTPSPPTPPQSDTQNSRRQKPHLISRYGRVVGVQPPQKAHHFPAVWHSAITQKWVGVSIPSWGLQFDACRHPEDWLPPCQAWHCALLSLVTEVHDVHATDHVNRPCSVLPTDLFRHIQVGKRCTASGTGRVEYFTTAATAIIEHGTTDYDRSLALHGLTCSLPCTLQLTVNSDSASSAVLSRTLRCCAHMFARCTSGKSAKRGVQSKHVTCTRQFDCHAVI